MHNTGSWCRGVPATEDHTRCHSCQLLQSVEVAFHMDSPEHLWDVPKYVKNVLHTITPWALIIDIRQDGSVLQCCLHQIVTPKGDSSDQATFSSLLFFHLKLTKNLHPNWCCNWKLLHRKLVGNSSCCDLTCNYISHKCKRCRRLWRCIKMGFQLS